MNERRPRILWGLTGSVATIRADRLAEQLLQLGEVKAVVTHRARAFLPALPESISIHDDQDEWSTWQQLGDPVLHIELRRWADLFVIAPASADVLAKMSAGISDTLLLSVARAWDFTRPLLVAPAMNTLMWEHPTTAEHLNRLTSWGARVISPVSKKLACEDVGMGALAPPEEIAELASDVLKATMRP